MRYIIFGNDLIAWTIALAIAACVTLLLFAAKRLVVRRLRSSRPPPKPIWTI